MNSHSAGAIGVLALKKTKDGVWLYWGHNTDSFVSHCHDPDTATSTDASAGYSFNVLGR
jgi:taspase (threonine aspartase 1)